MRNRIPLAISLVALFFSLTGASFAAGHYLITSKHQIAPWVRAALKGERGSRGYPGARGPQGTTGSAGQAADVQAPTTLFSQNVELTTNSPRTTLTVECPAGESPAGGGYSTGPSVLITTSRPDVDEYLGAGAWRPTGWLVLAQLAPGQTDAFVQASVECSS